MSPSKDEERAGLQTMLDEARVMVLRLENALGRLDSTGASDHPVLYWRTRRNMSQAALARQVGVTPAAICRIENSPGLAARKETCRKLAEALAVPLEWLTSPGMDVNVPPLQQAG